MSKQDYYELLNVSRTASGSEIKAAYRKAALKYHPDRNPGDKEAETRFKEVSEAYEVLTDSRKRQIYDKFGHQGLAGQGYSGPQDVNDIFSSFGSIFEDFFGFSGQGSRARRGADLRYDLEISFEEAVFGVERQIEFDRYTACETCDGDGADPRYGRTTCTACGGHGQVRRNQGFFSVAVTCSACRGEGSVVKKACAGCKGKGVVAEHKKISVKVPAGVDTGLKLRVSGEGEGAPGGGGHGDLYVVLHVQESERFVRDGVDIVLPVGVSFVQAALGGTLEIETLDGSRDIQIPAGVQPGHRLTIPGAGVPHLRGAGRGDFFVELRVQIPTKLNKEQRSLLEKFAEISSGHGADSKQGSFFQRIFD